MPKLQMGSHSLRTADPEATVKWFETVMGAGSFAARLNGKPRIDMKLGGANFHRAGCAGEAVNQRR